jgi:hypothetical protein
VFLAKSLIAEVAAEEPACREAVSFVTDSSDKKAEYGYPAFSF